MFVGVWRSLAVTLSAVDLVIIGVYLVVVFVAGVYMERRAARSVNNYFLGSRRMPWWVLGMSGSSNYFDVSGTMWMVSVFYVLGMRGMWQHIFWAFPFAGIMIAYKAKWAYRSQVLTAMEWQVLRYGSGAAGQAARVVNVVVFLVLTVLMLGYAGVGIAKFVGVFLPVDRSLIVPLVFGFTGVYVVVGGFLGVVYSDFIHTIVLSFAAIYIGVAAFFHIDPAAFRAAVGPDWFSLSPAMRLVPPSAEYPDLLGLLIVIWVVKGVMVLLTVANGPEFQRFRAARSEAEASKIGFAWGMVISVRWCMVMGLTAVGLSKLGGQAVDSESVLPMMVQEIIPVGMKGLVLAGLLAAFMSTFDSTLNVAASFVVNDLVKPVWKTASQKALVRVGYAATVIIILLGIAISMYTERISAIWNPINFALGAALIVPSLLAGYWWRINGWTNLLCGACTMPAAFYIKMFTDMREAQYFPILIGINLASCVLGAYLLPETPPESLKEYYRKVRPFGAWGRARRLLADSGEYAGRFERDRYDVPVAVLGVVFFTLVYVFMMDLVLHNWARLAVLAALLAATGGGVYVLWWRPLARAEKSEVRVAAEGAGSE